MGVQLQIQGQFVVMVPQSLVNFVMTEIQAMIQHARQIAKQMVVFVEMDLMRLMKLVNIQNKNGVEAVGLHIKIPRNVQQVVHGKVILMETRMQDKLTVGIMMQMRIQVRQ